MNLYSAFFMFRQNISKQRTRFGLIVLVLGLIVASVCGVQIWYACSLASLREHCRSATERREWAALEVDARTFTRREPLLAEGWLCLANAVQHQQRFLEAAEYLGEIPESSPEFSGAALAQAKLFFGPCNLPLRGVVACNRVLSFDRGSVEAHRLLVEFYAITLQRQEMRSVIRSSIANRCDRIESFLYLFLVDSLRLGNAFQVNSLWLNESPDSELFSVARVLQMEDKINQGDVDAPIEKQALSEKGRQVRGLLQRYPSNVNLLAYEIDVQIALGNTQTVLDLMSQAASDAEQDNRFWRFKAWIHHVSGEFEEAAKACDKSLELHPMDWMCMQLLSEIRRRQQQLTDARRLQDMVSHANAIRTDIRKLSSLSNVSSELLGRIGQFASDSGDIQVAEAIARHLASRTSK